MVAQTKTCQNCKNPFVIEPDDFAFYEKIDVPAPTFCFSCRLQRRIAWRNERALYKRACDLCKKSTFSMYPTGVTFPVYCRSCWFSDSWNPLAYGRGYDFSKSFFVQFDELQKVVPRVALQVDNSINCDYTNQIANCKNCYLITSAIGDEDCMYDYRVNYSKNVVDSFLMLKCENCYQSVECRDSANLNYTENCADGVDQWFCYDASSSQNCFMTSNVRRASNRFYDKALSKQEYQDKLKETDTGSYRKLEQYRKDFDALYRRSIHRFSNSKNVVNSIGHAYSNAKNCYYCFNGSDLENCRYAILINDAKDCMDVNNGGHIMELMYEVNTTGVHAYNTKFCNDAWPEVDSLTYCDSCRSGSSYLFGCISLRKKQYCVLNKQYTKQEYEALIKKIREHMDKMPYADKYGIIYKYGEFFPIELSVFPYNDSMAQDFFELTEKEAIAHGLRWRPETEKHTVIDITAEQLPDRIQDVDDDILSKIVGCVHAGKCNDRCTIGFRLIQNELQLYRSKNVPIPRLCPNCRYYERFRKRLPFRMYSRQCMCDYQIRKNTVEHAHHTTGRCPNEFKTIYSPDRPEIVYCEQCYNAEVV